MSADVFSCDYDAPMYVDFASIDQRLEDDQADAWFDAAAAKEAGGDDELDGMFDGEVADEVTEEEEEEGEEEHGTEHHEEVHIQEKDAVAGVIEDAEALHAASQEGSPVLATKSHPMSLRRSASSASRPPNSGHKAPASGPKKSKLTMPETPDFVRRGRQRFAPGARVAVKSSEELELERINKLREERRKAVQASQDSYRQLSTAASSACAALPKRAAVAPTIPVGFNFRTESRLAKNGPVRPDVGSQGDGSGKFVRHLRSYNDSKTNKGPVRANHAASPTHPKPFKFHQTRAQARQGDKENNALTTTDADGKTCPGRAAAKYMTAAEHLRKFHNATPDRFRTLPRSELNKGPIQPKGNGAKTNVARVTVPVTPKLTSKTRLRPVVAESMEEKEVKQVEEMRSHRFKATKFDPRIFSENGSYGLPRRNTPKTTVPVPLTLETNKRCEDRAAKATHNTPVKHFRAQPIPDQMFDHPLGVPEKAPASLTNAKTPNIRKSKRKAEDILEAQAKRTAQENEEVRPPSPPRSTVVQPFELRTDVRGAHKVEQWQHQVAAEEEASRQAKQFHARSANAVYAAPFVPEPSHRAPTVPDNVRLNSDVRAERRQEFDEMRNEKELEMAEEQYRRKVENEERSREEVERLRAAMVHKAQPVRHYRQVDVKPSERPLTKPTSPSFSERITVKYQRARTPQRT